MYQSVICALLFIVSATAYSNISVCRDNRMSVQYEIPAILNVAQKSGETKQIEGTLLVSEPSVIGKLGYSALTSMMACSFPISLFHQYGTTGAAVGIVSAAAILRANIWAINLFFSKAYFVGKGKKPIEVLTEGSMFRNDAQRMIELARGAATAPATDSDPGEFKRFVLNVERLDVQYALESAEAAYASGKTYPLRSLVTNFCAMAKRFVTGF